MKKSRVKGFITEQHEKEVEAVFEPEVRQALSTAKEGETFLGIMVRLGIFEKNEDKS